jgi:general secretion pathway protein K
MILVYVLWSLALLAAVAFSVTSTAVSSYRVATNGVDSAQAQAAVEVAINLAVLGLLDRRPQQRWRVDGVPRQINIEDFKARVTIQDELGRIDLNHADGPLFTRLFASAGLQYQDASAMADKVQDWREGGAFKRLNGAKDPEYAAAGLTYRPRKGPFQSIDELNLVMGMTPDLFRRVAPAITVYSARPVIDPQFAPREALLALPSMTVDAVSEVVAARMRQGATSSPAGTPIGIISPMVALGGRAFSIRVEVERANTALAREAVVRLTDEPSHPFWFLAWKNS